MCHLSRFYKSDKYLFAVFSITADKTPRPVRFIHHINDYKVYFKSSDSSCDNYCKYKLVTACYMTK